MTRSETLSYIEQNYSKDFARYFRDFITLNFLKLSEQEQKEFIESYYKRYLEELELFEEKKEIAKKFIKLLEKEKVYLSNRFIKDLLDVDFLKRVLDSLSNPKELKSFLLENFPSIFYYVEGYQRTILAKDYSAYSYMLYAIIELELIKEVRDERFNK